MYVLLDVYLSVSGHILFVSAFITVHFCTYPSQYLHTSQFVSARIPVCICTFPNSYLHISYSISECIPVCTYLHVSPTIPFVSECIPVRISLCPVCVCICNLMYILPNICPAGQPNYHTHTHTHTHTQPQRFSYAWRKRRCLVSAASATASVGVTARSCLLLHRFPEKCCVRAKSKECICLHYRLIGRENRCQWPWFT